MKGFLFFLKEEWYLYGEEAQSPKSPDQKRAKKENFKASSCSQTPDPIGIQSLWCGDSNLAPGCSLPVGPRPAGSRLILTLLREGHSAGETLFSLPGNFQSYGLGAVWLGRWGVLSRWLCFLLSFLTGLLPKCCILLYPCFPGRMCPSWRGQTQIRALLIFSASWKI